MIHCFRRIKERNEDEDDDDLSYSTGSKFERGVMQLMSVYVQFYTEKVVRGPH